MMWNEATLAAMQTWGNSPSWLTQWRQQQLQHFLQQGFPDRRVEAWKYTSLAKLSRQDFRLNDVFAMAPSLNLSTLAMPNAHLMVFINGHYLLHVLQDDGLPEGVVFTGMHAAVSQHAGVYQQGLADHADQPLMALNAALVSDGVFLQVPDDVVIEAPIHIVYLSERDADETMMHTRHQISLGERSQVTIIEEYIGLEESAYFNNVVTHIDLGKQAKLHYYKCQKEHNQAYHIARTEVRQQQDSEFYNYHFSLGAQLSRDDIHVSFDGAGASCELLGLYRPSGVQHMDVHLTADHHQPNCRSVQHYRGLIADKGHAVFNGRVMVAKDAQQSVAHQTNKNLLLSKHAHVDTKPELEIYADDVQCSHGATIGQLDEQALFYLQSRGISKDAAMQLLEQAFFDELMALLPDTAAAKYMRQQVMGASL